MFAKAVTTYNSTIQFLPECNQIQAMCNKAVNRCLFGFVYVPDWYKIQEMCDSVISEDPFIVPIGINLKECVMKLLMIAWQYSGKICS